MIVLLMGAPGCGKGTQAALLKEKYGLKHVSTGNLLREEIAKGSAVGIGAKKLIDNGNLVSDEMVLGLLKSQFDDKGKGIILDGYPRTLKQAQDLDALLKARGEELSSAIYLNLEIEEIVTRLISRRQCKNCGNIFNIRFIANFDGKCPKCGSTNIFQREDDNEAAAKHRIDVYIKETLPVKDFYSSKPYFHEINANRGIDEVFQNIEKSIF
ncbi:adenylate kinase [Elusimicrobium posterum]|uniref:adenylate kinase n=1 Tax=Elusimicrobium posterum TaxID=3116653 RepID=UPI003C78EA2C